MEAADIESSPEVEEAARAMLADGLSPVFVAVNGRVAGVAGIGDGLRHDARHTVQRLRARGVHVCIASGDHEDVVARVGSELGLPAEDVHGGLTPEAKRDLVARLVATADASHCPPSGRPPRTGAIVMVGDGVNDAAALALADVGIAVQGGMGATIVAADIVLTREGVRPLLDIMDGAHRLRGVVRRNIAFSLIYNASAASLALAGFVGPLLAAVLMPLSSLIVVLSSSLSRTFALSAGRVAARSTRDPLGA
jgi:Cu2+-exporting ATPase